MMRLNRPLRTGCSRFLRLSSTNNMRSEEHTSELQSLAYLVCRLLLEKKNSPLPIAAGEYTPAVPSLASLLRRHMLETQLPSLSHPPETRTCSSGSLPTLAPICQPRSA